MTLKIFKTNPSVLVVKPSALGDIVHTFPVVRAIKRAAPEVSIDWVVSDKYSDLVRLSPYVDDTIPFRRDEWAGWWKASTIREVFDHIRGIREREYGAVLDLQGLLRSGLITFFSRSQVKIGFEYAREGAALFYNRKIPALNHGAHAVDRYLSALAGLGIQPEETIAYDLKTPVKESLWANMVTPKAPFVVINPNSRWETKRWPVEKFGELAAELYRNEGLNCVIVGGPDDIERGREVARLAGDGITDLTSRGGLVHLAAVINKAVGMFTNDSGPLHLAVALGTPAISIFGPTSPGATGPYGAGHACVQHDLFCIPCFKKRCPYDLECLKELPVSEVLEAWRGLNSKGK